MTTTFYKQCKLRRGTSFDVAWIPEQFAIQDKYLRIKTDAGEEDGWKVEIVGANRVDGVFLKEHERNYLSQREASDI